MNETSNIVPLRQPDEIDDPLTNILRAGARQLLAQAVEMEVETFLRQMVGPPRSATNLSVLDGGPPSPRRRFCTRPLTVGKKMIWQQSAIGLSKVRLLHRAVHKLSPLRWPYFGGCSSPVNQPTASDFIRSSNAIAICSA
jgi:hypothetical protein